jgi:Ca-activated chloride channel family protein
MKIQLRFILVAIVILAFAPLQKALALEDGVNIRITQVDNSMFPQVTVYVSVTNSSGEPLAVDPDRIQILENGQMMQPFQVSGSGGIGPLTSLLAIDVSGSMYDSGKLNAAKAAAQAYIEQMRPGDQAGLLTFNTNVTLLQAITTDHATLFQAINSLDARGDTTMFDALDKAVQLLQDVPGRKAIIVLTDGLDNRSKFTADDVIQAIQAGGLSISTIGLGDPAKLGINSGLDEAILQSLAAQAGGVYGYANDPASLLGLYEQYGRALQSEYRITYTSSSTLHDGLNRTLTVSLGGSASTQASYNPGGVLPEVSKAASWPLFAAILVGLVGLLFVPRLAGRLHSSSIAKNRKKATGRQEQRIKLK